MEREAGLDEVGLVAVVTVNKTPAASVVRRRPLGSHHGEQAKGNTHTHLAIPLCSILLDIPFRRMSSSSWPAKHRTECATKQVT